MLPAWRSRSLLGALGVVVFFVTVYAGLAGTDGQSENLAPTMVYVAFWVGVPFASLLLGDVFGVHQPVARARPRRRLGRRALHRATRCPSRCAYPERLGRSRPPPGCSASRSASCAGRRATEPGPLAIIMLLYFVAMLVGMSLYGVDAVDAQRRRVRRPVRR